MADYEFVLLITDSDMKKITEDSDDKQIVKTSSLTPEMKAEFTPFNRCFFVGIKDHFGRMTKKIVGDANNITVSGVFFAGVVPMPWEESYSIGDNITADDIFEVITEGSQKKQGFAQITKLILGKDQDDLDASLNYFAGVDSEHGRPVKYAEEVMKAEENVDIFNAEYETYMAEVGMSRYPQSKMFQSNV